MENVVIYNLFYMNLQCIFYVNPYQSQSGLHARNHYENSHQTLHSVFIPGDQYDGPDFDHVFLLYCFIGMNQMKSNQMGKTNL